MQFSDPFGVQFPLAEIPTALNFICNTPFIRMSCF